MFAAGTLIVGASTLAVAGTVRHVEWFGAQTELDHSGMAIAGQQKPFSPATGPDQKYVAIGGFQVFSKLALASCGLRAKPAMLDTTKRVPVGQTVVTSSPCDSPRFSVDVPDGMAVRAIQVCSTDDGHGHHTIGGIRVWPAGINADGQVTPLPVKVQKKPGGCEWKAKRSCPANQVAVAALAHPYGPSFGGITLKCAKVRKP